MSEEQIEFVLNERFENIVPEKWDLVVGECRRLQAEVKLWRPLTAAEAEQLVADIEGDLEANPFTDEEIERLMAKRYDPAERLSNYEEARLEIRLTKALARAAQWERIALALADETLKVYEASTSTPEAPRWLANSCGDWRKAVVGSSRTAALIEWDAQQQKGG